MSGTPPTPLFQRFHSPGDCASLQLLNTLESLTFIPFLGNESATRQLNRNGECHDSSSSRVMTIFSKKSSNTCLGEGFTFTKKCPEIFDSKHVSRGPLKVMVRVRPFGNSRTPTDETWWNGSWDPFTISIGRTFQENSKGSFLADDLSMCKGGFIYRYWYPR